MIVSAAASGSRLTATLDPVRSRSLDRLATTVGAQFDAPYRYDMIVELESAYTLLTNAARVPGLDSDIARFVEHRLPMLAARLQELHGDSGEGP